MSKTITIHDIARQAGVSSSTVSRVLNGNVPVARTKRDAVLAVVKQLQYRPNVIAQGRERQLANRGRAGGARPAIGPARRRADRSAGRYLR
jgi:DNA-binding LacI/PurR family transcriptional regulator